MFNYTEVKNFCTLLYKSLSDRKTTTTASAGTNEKNNNLRTGDKKN